MGHNIRFVLRFLGRVVGRGLGVGGRKRVENGEHRRTGRGGVSITKVATVSGLRSRKLCHVQSVYSCDLANNYFIASSPRMDDFKMGRREASQNAKSPRRTSPHVPELLAHRYGTRSVGIKEG